MKFTVQMEVNLSSEADLRRWQEQEQREKISARRELLLFTTSVGQLVNAMLGRSPSDAGQPVTGAEATHADGPVPPAPEAPAGSAVREAA